MKKVYKNFLIFLLFVLFLSLDISFAFAKKIEVNYPSLPGVSPITEQTKIPDYIKYVFHFGIIIAGVVVLFVMITAGVKYLTSAGNPEKLSDAKKSIIGGVLGLIILLSSYLILININPELIKLKEPDLLLMPGIYYDLEFGGATITRFLSKLEPLEDNNNLHKYGTAKKLFASCDDEYKTKEKEIRAFFFNEEDFEGDIKEVTIKCGGPPYTISSADKSVRFKPWRPGVTFYPTDNCQIPEDGPIPRLEGSVSNRIQANIFAGYGYWWTWSPYTKNVRSIKIYQDPFNSDPEKRIFVGIILFNQKDDGTLKGKTKYIYIPNEAEPCVTKAQLGDDFSINYNELSFQIFYYTGKQKISFNTLADLRSEPYPRSGGYYSIYEKDRFFQKNLSDIDVKYLSTSTVPPERRKLCQNFGGEDKSTDTILAPNCLQSVSLFYAEKNEYNYYLFCDTKIGEINWNSPPYPNCQLLPTSKFIDFFSALFGHLNVTDFTPLWIRQERYPKSLFIFRAQFLTSVLYYKNLFTE